MPSVSKGQMAHFLYTKIRNISTATRKANHTLQNFCFYALRHFFNLFQRAVGMDRQFLGRNADEDGMNLVFTKYGILTQHAKLTLHPLPQSKYHYIPMEQQ